MNRSLIGFVLLISLLAGWQASTAQDARHEHIEWSDIWIMNADRAEGPRVLLVGDSIVRGYYDLVEKHLAGKASCARYTTSKFLGNPDFLAELTLLLERYKFDWVHINNGLHGWDYSEEEYKTGLLALLAILEKHVPQENIIWCMTTPVRSSQDLSQLAEEQNTRVIARNRIATEVMKEKGIPVNDLYDAVKDHPEYFAKDGVHYNDDGKAVQAKRVVETIEKTLATAAN